MQSESSVDGVPWSAREAWLGVASLGLWFVLGVGASALLGYLWAELDPGVPMNLGEVLLLLPVWWLAMRKYRVGWEALGFRSFRIQALGLGCGFVVYFYVVNFLYNLLLVSLGVDTDTGFAPFFEELSSPWLVAFGGVVVAPLMEEVFFRGFIFAGLRRRYGWPWAAAISAALFAVVHLQLVTLIPIFGLGLAFAYLYQRSGSLWPAILMHAAVNGVSICVLLVSTRFG